MTTALWLLLVLGVVGAFDTLYFHEWRGRLVARPAMRPELRLHVARDAVYVVLFATLPTVAWHGWWTLVLAGLFFAEIVITLTDFVTEDRVRAELGGVFPGERITHAVMGIIYGAILAYLVPVLRMWWQEPTAFVQSVPSLPAPVRSVLISMAAGILLHGLRDLWAVLNLPGCSWPYREEARAGA